MRNTDVAVAPRSELVRKRFYFWHTDPLGSVRLARNIVRLDDVSVVKVDSILRVRSHAELRKFQNDMASHAADADDVNRLVECFFVEEHIVPFGIKTHGRVPFVGQ